MQGAQRRRFFSSASQLWFLLDKFHSCSLIWANSLFPQLSWIGRRGFNFFSYQQKRVMPFRLRSAASPRSPASPAGQPLSLSLSLFPVGSIESALLIMLPPTHCRRSLGTPSANGAENEAFEQGRKTASQPLVLPRLNKTLVNWTGFPPRPLSDSIGS